jgi:uncharacterized membrane protein YkvA (DUF1232 family)
MSKSASSSLDHYLSTMAAPGRAGPPSLHLERGAACVQPADLDRLRRMLPALRSKAARITDSAVLPRRLEVLMQFVAETSPTESSTALGEAAFALFYFLKGYDLIPDSVPGVGLLDDALLVETVFRRHAPELRAQWVAGGRVWPENF